jgi:hypothetical protein
MTSEYLDLPLRALRQVRDEAVAEYDNLWQIGLQLTVALSTASDNDRQLMQPRYDECRQRLAALEDRLETIDDEIEFRAQHSRRDSL